MVLKDYNSKFEKEKSYQNQKLDIYFYKHK